MNMAEKNFSISAVILAGGKSSRMNYRNKAFLELDGIPFIEKIIGTLSKVKEVMIVANNKQIYQHLGYKVVEDIISECGPMGGIYTGLIHARYNDVLVVACDMPFISYELVRFMATIRHHHQAVIPVLNHQLQPLCGIYNKECLEQLEMELTYQQLKLTKFLEKINTKYIAIGNILEQTKCFANINSEKEYRQLKEKGD